MGGTGNKGTAATAESLCPYCGAPGGGPGLAGRNNTNAGTGRTLCLANGYPGILPTYPERAALAPRMPFCPFAGAAEHY